MAINQTDLPHEAIKTGCLFEGRKACGARLKNRDGLCRQPAMKNGRCRIHGGTSTGAKTPAGKARSRSGKLKHGDYSAASLARHREVMALLKMGRKYLKELEA